MQPKCQRCCKTRRQPKLRCKPKLPSPPAFSMPCCLQACRLVSQSSRQLSMVASTYSLLKHAIPNLGLLGPFLGPGSPNKVTTACPSLSLTPSILDVRRPRPPALQLGLFRYCKAGVPARVIHSLVTSSCHAQWQHRQPLPLSEPALYHLP